MATQNFVNSPAGQASMKKMQTLMIGATHPYNPLAKNSKFSPKGLNPKAVAKYPGYKKGGKVKKTGLAKLHKGERVLNKKQTKKFDEEKFKKKFNKARMSFAKGN